MRRARPTSEYLARPAGWWRVPAGLVGVLRRRTMVPAPRIYLLAAAVGLVLGVAAQRLAGWPWWPVAAGLLAAVWLAFAATALRGRGSGRSLVTDLLEVADPDRAMRRRTREMEAAFRASPFPLYGLPAAWPGVRYLGGWGSRQARGEPPVTTNLCLAHGSPLTEEGPRLRVEVRPLSGPGQLGEDGPAMRERLAEELHWTATAGVGPPEPSEQGDRDWGAAEIPVDGRPVRFDLLAEGRHWVAVGTVRDVLVVLLGRDLAPAEVELVRVTDVEPYSEGSRRLGEGPAG
jgi:hypothetical protein